jgi:poly-beta-1,6-N-acetyl-D-glucosamine synthase
MRVRVGVFAHDEAATLENCVRAVLDQRLSSAVVVELTIVSCGSRDGTDTIAETLCAADRRVRLLRNTRREGKARAINRFLAAPSSFVDVVLLISGDVVLADGALERLLFPFNDPTVGMTGGRVVPQNERRGVGRLVHILWELHHRVASRSPKLGEAIALRAPVALLPEWTSADETSLEADVTQRRGLRLVYRSDAQLFNHGPSSLGDYVAHRRRIARAHSEVEAAGYRPATRNAGNVTLEAVRHVAKRPRDLPWVAVAAIVESWAWIAGSFDSRGDGVWAPLTSAKRPVRRTTETAPSP